MPTVTSTLRRDAPFAAHTATRLCAEFLGFALLLFATRFVARPHLAMRLDEECHIGGIAVDVLAHGIRFPLLVYPQNEYDNGALFSGVLAAASFAVLGRSLLALKLVMHLVAAAGAVGMLWLLRGCLDELGLTSRRVRWAATTSLVIAIAVAPRLVTGCAMCTVGFGTPAEGSAIIALMLAVFAHRAPHGSALRAAGVWLLVGFALFLNKGTLLMLPALAVAEIVLTVPHIRRLAAALGGFVVGILPEVLMSGRRQGLDWSSMVALVAHNARGFPYAFLDGIPSLADYRIELLAAWTLGLCVGVWALEQAILRWRDRRARVDRGPAGVVPLTLGVVVGTACTYVAAISIMAQGGLEYYAVYGYPVLVVLYAVLLARACAWAEARWGARSGAWAGAAAIGLTLVLYRPDALTLGFAQVADLWRNRDGAACSWRFAEGFEREHRFGIARLGDTYIQHTIERCRTLSEPTQVLDCIGGIARDLHFRRAGKVEGEPPAGLNAAERRAYAYYYGVNRNGNTVACRDFTDPQLQADCAASVQLGCLFHADFATRFFAGAMIGAPHCALPEPPMDGYWAALRRGFLASTTGRTPQFDRRLGADDLPNCRPVFDACYAAPRHILGPADGVQDVRDVERIGRSGGGARAVDGVAEIVGVADQDVVHRRGGVGAQGELVADVQSVMRRAMVERLGLSAEHRREIARGGLEQMVERDPAVHAGHAEAELAPAVQGDLPHPRPVLDVAQEGVAARAPAQQLVADELASGLGVIDVEREPGPLEPAVESAVVHRVDVEVEPTAVHLPQALHIAQRAGDEHPWAGAIDHLTVEAVEVLLGAEVAAVVRGRVRGHTVLENEQAAPLLGVRRQFPGTRRCRAAQDDRSGRG